MTITPDQFERQVTTLRTIGTMTLLKLPFLLPSILIFNTSYKPPTPAPHDDEVVSGGPLYEQICPVVYPVLQRVSKLLTFLYICEHLVTVIWLNTLCC